MDPARAALPPRPPIAPRAAPCSLVRAILVSVFSLQWPLPVRQTKPRKKLIILVYNYSTSNFPVAPRKTRSELRGGGCQDVVVPKTGRKHSKKDFTKPVLEPGSEHL